MDTLTHTASASTTTAAGPAPASVTAAPSAHKATPTATATSQQGKAGQPRLPVWARTLITMVAMFLAYVPIVAITLIPGISDALKPTHYAVNTVANVLGQGSVGITMLLLAILMLHLIDRRPIAALGLRVDLRGVGALLVGTAIAAGVMYATTAVLTAIGIIGTIPELPFKQAELPVALLFVFIISRAFLLQGFGEEVLFRGYLMQSLSAKPKQAVWVSALAFAVLHLVSQGAQEGVLDRILYLLLPLGFAVLAGHLAILMRSTWVAIGIHGGMHVGVMTSMQWLQWDSGSMPVTIASGLVFLALGLAARALIPQSRWEEVTHIGPYSAKAEG